ncbi:MAG TPA: DUF4136 domain-containing protein [Blastocatellia bacterium]|nr:DUF4136 domain-containing protein [Blastocatellia bacterium]
MKSLFVLASIILLAAPVAVRAQKVKVDYDHSVDFTKFKTYAWVKGSPASNPRTHQLILEEIDRQLRSKGLRRVESEADLNVAYHASLGEYINTGAVEYMKGADWKKWGDHNPVYGPKMVATPIARIVLDIIDASTSRLVWRGRANDAYTPNQARGERRVSRAAQKLLARFPPTSPE